MAEQGKPRRPGRPPKAKNITNTMVSFGIVDRPENEEALVELICESPKLFKILFTLIDNFDFSEISLRFERDGLYMSNKSPKGDVTFHTKIFGDMMIKYFCAEPITRRVRVEQLAKVFKHLSKQHTKVTMSINEMDSNSKFYISIFDADIACNTNSVIDILPGEDEEIEVIDDNEYPVSFEVPSKNFKSITKTYSKYYTKLIIRKDGPDNPLYIGYDGSNVDNFGVGNTFEDPKLIDLKSNLLDDDIFCVSVPIVLFKPFTNAAIGEKISIKVDSHNPISFFTEMNKKEYIKQGGTIVKGYTCQFKLFVKIESTF